MDASFWFVVGGVYGFHGFKSKHKNRAIGNGTNTAFGSFFVGLFQVLLRSLTQLREK
jgi:hypothetical protein